MELKLKVAVIKVDRVSFADPFVKYAKHVFQDL